MATLYTHAAVGLAIGRCCVDRGPRWWIWLVAAALPIVPDLDALSDAPYPSAFGHRGFTHSLCFALGIGLVIAAVASRPLKMRFWMTCGLCFLITASHGVLDAFTSGGAGIPFFWPLSERRFGPWGPIHLADIADDFPNPWRSRAIQTELLWVWLPMTIGLGLIEARRWWRRRAMTADSQARS